MCPGVRWRDRQRWTRVLDLSIHSSGSGRVRGPPSGYGLLGIPLLPEIYQLTRRISWFSDEVVPTHQYSFVP
jgi:hypothetical protein